jgi:hypothetical protein
MVAPNGATKWAAPRQSPSSTRSEEAAPERQARWMQISKRECEMAEEAIYKTEKILGQLQSSARRRMGHGNAST